MAAKNAKAGAEIVIVGGGVTGLSAAWWLAKAGLDVLVIDKGIVGWEASGRNGGGTTHFHSPLFHEEQRLWPQMDELLGYPTEWRAERVLIAADEHDIKLFAAWRKQGRRLGHKVTDLDSKEVMDLVPVASQHNLGGIRLHFGGQANPQRTAQAYAWAVQDLGGRILQHTPALQLIHSGGRIVGVETPRGVLGLESIVVAAGPQTGSLLKQVGISVPLAVARAEMIVTEPAPMMSIGGIDGNGMYGRQTLRGNLAFGGGPHEWLSMDGHALQRPTSPVIRSLALRLSQLLPGIARLRLIRSWAGLVENTPDGRPIIDRLDQFENLVVASMSSVGFGLSPASGRAIRDLVIEGRCTFTDIEKLKLNRFATLSANWIEDRGWLPPLPTDRHQNL